jgi:hypothetical protein
MAQADRPSTHWALRSAAIAVAATVMGAFFAMVPSAALASPSPTSSQARAGDFSEEEGEEGEEAWEAEVPEGDGGWVELEEASEDEELDEGAASSLPPECVLRTVRPEAVLDATHEKLRLTLRYTSRNPTRVGLDLWLRGGKGSLRLGVAKRQLGRSGVLRLSRHLDPLALARARAARTVTVQLDVTAAPSSCRPHLTVKLTSKQVLGSRTTWSVTPERRRT